MKQNKIYERKANESVEKSSSSKFTLLFSIKLVTITMIETFCSQIICQKSATVCTDGPVTGRNYSFLTNPLKTMSKIQFNLIWPNYLYSKARSTEAKQPTNLVLQCTYFELNIPKKCITIILMKFWLQFWFAFV